MHPDLKEKLEQLPERGVRFQAEMLYAELDMLRALRPKAKGAMIAEGSEWPQLPIRPEHLPLTGN